MDSVELFKKDSSGTIRVWSIVIDHEMECLLITHGVLGGSLQEKEEYIEEGKASRDIDEQLESRMNSRVNKKLDNGYVKTIGETALPVTNALGLLRPMRAKPTVDKDLVFKKTLIDSIDWNNAFLQRKYNGLRCLIKNECGELIAYSRGGKRWESLGHILDCLSIPEGVTIDGELYHHGTHLQTINSWAKRKQENTLKLRFLAYDVISDESYSKRFKKLSEICLSSGDKIILAETAIVINMDGCTKYFNQFREDGYEGAIIRHGSSGYEVDKRSSSTLKLKAWFDDEFIVNDITESPRDGMAVLHMSTENGLSFKATAPGSFAEKREALRNKDEYIGFSVTIRYAEKTKDGKPAQPVAVAWRERGE